MPILMMSFHILYPIAPVPNLLLFLPLERFFSLDQLAKLSILPLSPFIF